MFSRGQQYIFFSEKGKKLSEFSVETDRAKPPARLTLAGGYFARGIITTLPRAQRSVRQRRDARPVTRSRTLKSSLDFKWSAHGGSAQEMRCHRPRNFTPRAAAGDVTRLTAQDLTDAEAQQYSVFSVLEMCVDHLPIPTPLYIIL
jgi:hypothetical protein